MALIYQKHVATRPVEAVAGFDEALQLLVRVIHDICMKFNSMVYTKWTCEQDD